MKRDFPIKVKIPDIFVYDFVFKETFSHTNTINGKLINIRYLVNSVAINSPIYNHHANQKYYLTRGKNYVTQQKSYTLENQSSNSVI